LFNVRIPILLLMAAGFTLGCAAKQTTSAPSQRSGTVLASSAKGNKASKSSSINREKASSKSAKASKSPRKVSKVPPGQYPPAGMCRLWYDGRAPGKQPKSTECSNLKGKVPANSFVLYNGKDWDAQYDWRKEKKSSIPAAIRDVLLAVKH
jgi:hypothetical protein